jgi:hypothetical protein
MATPTDGGVGVGVSVGVAAGGVGVGSSVGGAVSRAGVGSGVAETAATGLGDGDALGVGGRLNRSHPPTMTTSVTAATAISPRLFPDSWSLPYSS